MSNGEWIKLGSTPVLRLSLGGGGTLVLSFRDSLRSESGAKSSLPLLLICMETSNADQESSSYVSGSTVRHANHLLEKLTFSGFVKLASPLVSTVSKSKSSGLHDKR